MDSSIDAFELNICKGAPRAPQGITVAYTATASRGVEDLGELWKQQRPQILAKSELVGFELPDGAEDVTLGLQKRTIKAVLKFRPIGSASNNSAPPSEVHDNITSPLAPRRPLGRNTLPPSFSKPAPVQVLGDMPTILPAPDQAPGPAQG